MIDIIAARQINDSLIELNEAVGMLKAVKDRRGIANAQIGELVDRAYKQCKAHTEATLRLTKAAGATGSIGERH